MDTERFARTPVDAEKFARTIARDKIPAMIAALAARLMADVPVAPPMRLVDRSEAARLLGVSESWLNRHTALPFRVRLSHRKVRYSVAGIQTYLSRRIGR
jgi:predicted DNA-binding transcriptional regulator AlpA